VRKVERNSQKDIPNNLQELRISYSKAGAIGTSKIISKPFPRRTWKQDITGVRDFL
jgi:hypothetical protein